MGGDCIQMPKFFVKSSEITSGKAIITGEDVNHIKKVLRLSCNDNIIISDGQGNDYLANIEKIEKDFISTVIISSQTSNTEPPIDVILFQGLPKSDKMEFIIQKSVELGVGKIVPVITERTVVRVDSKKDADNKVTRWQRISMEAAKQCNRGVIPHVEYPMTFEKALEFSGKADLKIIPYEKEKKDSIQMCIEGKHSIKTVAVFIGPEGGFAEKEIEKAQHFGIKPVMLGPRILRTETAGIMVLSILMYELGDVNG